MASVAEGSPYSVEGRRTDKLPVVIIFGASYGIGAVTALYFGRAGWGVTVAGRSEVPRREGRSTIHSTAQEITKAGGHALAVACDVRKAPESINAVVEQTLKHFAPLNGELRFVIYNSGAIHIAPVSETPLRRYDLLQEVNARGLYSTIQAVLPHLVSQVSPSSSPRMKIVVISPPIYQRFFKGKTTYAMTKVAMTVLVHGLAKELEESDCAISALWPAVAVESAATESLNESEEGRGMLRKADVFAQALLALANEQGQSARLLNGKALIDEDYLRDHHGWKPEDFAKYRCVPDREPPRMMPLKFPDLRVEEEEESTFKNFAPGEKQKPANPNPTRSRL